ncbi:response regulator [Catellatospora tritici]|uniref:response regulator n=1 Tax=Catellatospora tritici TaxID=2851566 RepID=UPI001C2D08F2|nr:response regulator transcription factor [Catellatospora tritici]MBV1851713.1 response regulator transcription factor [Catellatospora tritici]
MIKVMIVDDNDIIRRGLATIIDADEGLRVVADAGDGRSAVEAARRMRPDIALVDIRMPIMDGLAATRELLKLPDPPKVIILTTFHTDEYVDEAIRSGAAGFLLKDSPPEELVRALYAVGQGHAMLDPAVTRQVIDSLAGRSPLLSSEEKSRLDALTPREVDVLRLVGRGLSNADIGAELFMTEGTVKGYVSAILTKLEADNRVQAARLAYRAGLDA